jgi:hypothetical protein
MGTDYRYCLPQLTIIMIIDIPIIPRVNHPITLYKRLLVLSLRTFLSFAIFITAKRIGTAIHHKVITTPLFLVVAVLLPQWLNRAYAA